MSIDVFPFELEHIVTEPLHTDRDNAGASWLKGYTDGFKGSDVHEPDVYRVEYLRGFIAGLKAIKGA